MKCHYINIIPDYGYSVLKVLSKSSILAFASFTYSSEFSIPIYLLSNTLAANAVVPIPINGSKTTSPFLVNNLINHVGNSNGKTAL
jgi:hypothetical protein